MCMCTPEHPYNVTLQANPKKFVPFQSNSLSFRQFETRYRYSKLLLQPDLPIPSEA